MTRRRILHVIPSLDQSGAEKQLALAAQYLPRDEFDIHVCALTRGGHYEDLLRTAGIPVHLINKRLKIDPWAVARLVQVIRDVNPDVLQTWMFAGNAYGRLAGRWAGAPRIIAGERCVDEWKGGHHFVIDRLLMRWTDRLVVNAEAIRSFYVEHGISGERIVTIPNAIEESPLPSEQERQETRRALGLSDGRPLIAFVGRLWPQKRVQDLIWAADILRMSGWACDVVIVGDGPRRASLERFAEDLDILPTVRFLGHRKDAGAIIAAADVLVLPSKFEGTANVLLEAMMRARPVVATRIPGNTEVVVDGQTGILVPVKSPLELARGIRQLLADPESAAEMGRKGRERVLSEFSIETMIANYRRLYDEVIGGG